MSAYLSTLVAISALVGICSFLSLSEGEDKGLRIAASVVLVYVVALPVVTLVKEGAVLDFDYNFFDFSDVSFEDTEFSKSAEASFADGIKAMLTEKFSLSPEKVKIVIFGFDGRNMKAEKIKVILTGSAALADARGIEAAVKSAGLGECEVEIGASE